MCEYQPGEGGMTAAQDCCAPLSQGWVRVAGARRKLPGGGGRMVFKNEGMWKSGKQEVRMSLPERQQQEQGMVEDWGAGEWGGRGLVGGQGGKSRKRGRESS